MIEPLVPGKSWFRYPLHVFTWGCLQPRVSTHGFNRHAYSHECWFNLAMRMCGHDIRMKRYSDRKFMVWSRILPRFFNCEALKQTWNRQQNLLTLHLQPPGCSRENLRGHSENYSHLLNGACHAAIPATTWENAHNASGHGCTTFPFHSFHWSSRHFAPFNERIWLISWYGLFSLLPGFTSTLLGVRIQTVFFSQLRSYIEVLFLSLTLGNSKGIQMIGKKHSWRFFGLQGRMVEKTRGQLDTVWFCWLLLYFSYPFNLSHILLWWELYFFPLGICWYRTCGLEWGYPKASWLSSLCTWSIDARNVLEWWLWQWRHCSGLGKIGYSTRNVHGASEGSCQAAFLTPKLVVKHVKTSLRIFHMSQE